MTGNRNWGIPHLKPTCNSSAVPPDEGRRGDHEILSMRYFKTSLPALAAEHLPRKKHMTTVQITLPDQLSQEAQRAGLLSSTQLERWLREQLKIQRIDEWFATMDRMASRSEPIVLEAPVGAGREHCTEFKNPTAGIRMLGGCHSSGVGWAEVRSPTAKMVTLDRWASYLSPTYGLRAFAARSARHGEVPFIRH